MKISVVIPTHKPDIGLFKQTLEALSNQRGLRIDEYEVLVVENPQIIRETALLIGNYSPNFQLLKSQIGSNNARNWGIEQAQSEIIALTDDDCVPNDTWLSDLLSLHGVFPSVGVIAGPLTLDFCCEQPEWIVNDFRALLSEVKWTKNKVQKGPFDIDDYPERWVVSANLSFTKTMYDLAGRLDGDIGLHGKSNYISNDEIQFVNRAAKIGSPKILWDNRLDMKHLVPESRCTIEFLEDKSYGQGYSNGLMWIEDNAEKPVNDLYHDFVQHSALNFISYDSVCDVRAELCNENNTRQFIRNLIIAKSGYMRGAIDALEGNGHRSEEKNRNNS